jgi:hypothetical protein
MVANWCVREKAATRSGSVQAHRPEDVLDRRHGGCPVHGRLFPCRCLCHWRPARRRRSCSPVWLRRHRSGRLDMVDGRGRRQAASRPEQNRVVDGHSDRMAILVCVGDGGQVRGSRFGYHHASGIAHRAVRPDRSRHPQGYARPKPVRPLPHPKRANALRFGISGAFPRAGRPRLAHPPFARPPFGLTKAGSAEAWPPREGQ